MKYNHFRKWSGREEKRKNMEVGKKRGMTTGYERRENILKAVSVTTALGQFYGSIFNSSSRVLKEKPLPVGYKMMTHAKNR